jgi:hypothetical protein
MPNVSLDFSSPEAGRASRHDGRGAAECTGGGLEVDRFLRSSFFGKADQGGQDTGYRGFLL